MELESGISDEEKTKFRSGSGEEEKIGELGSGCREVEKRG